MELYMIRHGETEWNRMKKLQGHTDIALNDAGRALAVQVGHALRDVPFTRAVSSPLSRAVEPARLVLAAAGRTLEIETDPRIEEISFGEMEGVLMNGEAQSPEQAKLQDFFSAPEKYRPPKGGETLEHLLFRTGQFLEEMASSCHEQDTILVSVHGACMRALQANICHRNLAGIWDGCVPPNCAVSVAVLEKGVWRLESQDVMYYGKGEL